MFHCNVAQLSTVGGMLSRSDHCAKQFLRVWEEHAVCMAVTVVVRTSVLLGGGQRSGRVPMRGCAGSAVAGGGVAHGGGGMQQATRVPRRFIDNALINSTPGTGLQLVWGLDFIEIKVQVAKGPSARSRKAPGVLVCTA